VLLNVVSCKYPVILIKQSTTHR